MREYKVKILVNRKPSDEDRYYLVDIEADSRKEAKNKAVEELLDYLSDQEQFLHDEYGFDKELYTLKRVFIPNDAKIRHTVSEKKLLEMIAEEADQDNEMY